MTPTELTAARHAIGLLWGLERPLTRTELGCAIGLGAKRPGEAVRAMERGHDAIGGPVALLLQAIIATGWYPPDLDARLDRAESLDAIGGRGTGAA